MMRRPKAPKHSILEKSFSLIMLFLVSSVVFAQVDTASIQGTVVDPRSAVLPNTAITITNEATSELRTTTTTGSGNFTFSGLTPGTYVIRAEHMGFQALSLPALVLNVGARNSLTLHMQVGSASETVTVAADQDALETTDVGVSNVINQKEVANLPLNGRSFQDLILLTPGTTTNSPQGTKADASHGALSVNGQGTNSNNFIVDGISANSSAGNNGGFTNLGAAGAAPVGTSLGTTQSIVPVDDLQEFRVTTSSYSAEFGNGQGGQITFTTRSGTNQYHGGAFDYLRNTAFDANDYFNKFNQPAIGREPLHQNDFGGFIGGPVIIPHLYDGRGKTFFFGDDESLRLTSPVASTIGYVPNDLLRAQAPGAIKAVVNAFPEPNGVDVSCDPQNFAPNPVPTGCSPQNQPGLAVYTAGYSNTSRFDSYNLRIDQVFPKGQVLFLRASNTPSSSSGNGLAQFNTTVQNTRTYTAGLTSAFSSAITNELRANFTTNTGVQSGSVQQQGSATPLNLLTEAGYSANRPNYDVGFSYAPAVGAFYIADYRGINATRQFEVVDSVNLTRGEHQLKFGVDFRRLTSTTLPESPLTTPGFYSINSLLANTIDYDYLYVYASSYPQYLQFGFYAQDNWRLNPRFTLSYGLRWDINPAPSSRRGPNPYSLVNQNNLSELALGPTGAPIYNTYYGAIAPRIGGTYLLHQAPGHETQIRIGTGLFYDTGTNNTDALAGYVGPGFSAGYSFCPYSYCTQQGNFSYPLAPQFLNPVIQIPPSAPYTATTAYGFPTNFAPPYSIQGNASLEQQLGGGNALTLSYVMALNRKGVATQAYNILGINPNFETVDLTSNRLRAQYNSAQVVFQHRVTRGLFAYAAYTWAHALGENQFNQYTPYVHGNTGGDLRHNFNVAATWDIPAQFSNETERALLGHWGIDLRFTARSGFPLTLFGQKLPNTTLGTGAITTGVLYAPGYGPRNIYTSTINGQRVPGGRAFNPNAFVNAPGGTAGQLGVNTLRGFGADQTNLAIRREFPIYEAVHLQFRAEAFNILNQSNFGAIDTYLPDITFGQATSTLANSLGGLASQYQTGGPRSLQLALKLLF